MGEQISWQKIVAPGKKVLYFFLLIRNGVPYYGWRRLGESCLPTDNAMNSLTR